MKIDTSGFERLARKFEQIAEPDTRPLMFSWAIIADESNKAGILAGTDKDGNPLAPVTYRPVQSKGAKLTADQKNGVARKRRGIYAGFGPHASGLHNNLASAEYRKLDGPPLAPRRGFSRVITNFVMRFDSNNRNARILECGWADVANVLGRPFLGYHFRGAGHLPVRDLRGFRPDAVERMKRSMVAWMRDIIRTYGSRNAA